jgi:hypothetical protein
MKKIYSLSALLFACYFMTGCSLFSGDHSPFGHHEKDYVRYSQSRPVLKLPPALQVAQKTSYPIPDLPKTARSQAGAPSLLPPHIEKKED